MSGEIHLHGPRFTMVPDEVIKLPLSHLAFRLYAVLLSFANKDGAAFPSNRTLCERMHVGSVETLRRAKLELVGAGLLAVESKDRENGSQTANDYLVSTIPGYLLTGEQEGVLTDEQESYLRTSIPEGDSEDLDSKIFPPETPPPFRVDGTVTTGAELSLSVAILGHWNGATGQALRSKEWHRRIILRIREYPELTLEEHAALIDAALGDPWWRGAPKPDVVYGNGAQFERVMADRAGGNGSASKRFGRGVTSDELRQRSERLRAEGR